jgi:hypothetical protein
LELVCEKMCSSGDYDNELEGLEIEGTNNCLRSHLGSLTNNMDDEDDDSMTSTDSEWDRMDEENRLLRAENERLQESLICLRKELGEARMDATSLSQELKYVKAQREVSSMNDVTMEMTDESFECMRRSNSIPSCVEGTERITDAPAPLSSSSISAEGEVNDAEDTIRLLLKCAYSARWVSQNNSNPKQDLHQDLLQLMANLRKLDGDRTKENVRASSPRKRGRTRGRDARTGTKERSQKVTKSGLNQIKEKSLSRKMSSCNANEHDPSGRCVRHPEVKLRRRKVFLPGTNYVFKWSKRLRYCPCCAMEFELAVDPEVKGQVGLSRGRLELLLPSANSTTDDVEYASSTAASQSSHPSDNHILSKESDSGSQAATRPEGIRDEGSLISS